jgi:hypothetical protein
VLPYRERNLVPRGAIPGAGRDAPAQAHDSGHASGNDTSSEPVEQSAGREAQMQDRTASIAVSFLFVLAACSLASVPAAWAEGYIEMLERPEREDFQKPDQAMEALAFKRGGKVADVGAGSGYFTVPVAEAVGPEGVVWACDIRQEMLDYVKNRLDKEGLDNVRPTLVEPDDPMLPDGRVVIIDYKPKPWEERPWGPPPEQQFPRETVDEEFAKAGLKVLRAHGFLPEQSFVEYGVAGE